MIVDKINNWPLRQMIKSILPVGSDDSDDFLFTAINVSKNFYDSIHKDLSTLKHSITEILKQCNDRGREFYKNNEKDINTIIDGFNDLKYAIDDHIRAMNYGMRLLLKIIKNADQIMNNNDIKKMWKEASTARKNRLGKYFKKQLNACKQYFEHVRDEIRKLLTLVEQRKQAFERGHTTDSFSVQVLANIVNSKNQNDLYQIEKSIKALLGEFRHTSRSKQVEAFDNMEIGIKSFDKFMSDWKASVSQIFQVFFFHHTLNV